MSNNANWKICIIVYAIMQLIKTLELFHQALNKISLLNNRVASMANAPR